MKSIVPMIIKRADGEPGKALRFLFPVLRYSAALK